MPANKKNKKPGRPPIGSAKRVRVSLTLPADIVKMLRKSDNASASAERLIRWGIEGDRLSLDSEDI
jgi:hypothetical protein